MGSLRYLKSLVFVSLNRQDGGEKKTKTNKLQCELRVNLVVRQDFLESQGEDMLSGLARRQKPEKL